MHYNQPAVDRSALAQCPQRDYDCTAGNDPCEQRNDQEQNHQENEEMTGKVEDNPSVAGRPLHPAGFEPAVPPRLESVGFHFPVVRVSFDLRPLLVRFVSRVVRFLFINNSQHIAPASSIYARDAWQNCLRATPSITSCSAALTSAACVTVSKCPAPEIK